MKSNNKNGSFGSLYDQLRGYFYEINEILEDKVKTNTPYDNLSSSHWRHIKLGYMQLRGLMNGYNKQAEVLEKPELKLKIEDFLIIQADGEVPELLSKVII